MSARNITIGSPER